MESEQYETQPVVTSQVYEFTSKATSPSLTNGAEMDEAEGTLTDEQLEELYLDARRRGMGPISAARYVGAPYRAMQAYIAANPDFSARVDDAVNESMEKVENKVMEAGQAGDLTAAKMILESHRPQEWTKPDREVMVRLGLDDNLNIDELRQRLELAHANAIDVESRELEPGEEDDGQSV